MLAPTLLLAAAVLAGAPDLSPPASAPAGEDTRRPAPHEGTGGPYEPAEEANVVVEGRPAETPPPFTIAPDPALARRYAPRERAPVNRIRIPF